MNDFNKDFMWCVGMAMSCLLIMLVLANLISCSPGWSVAGWEITPGDSSEVTLTIMDQDNVQHRYHTMDRREVRYCYEHLAYENVKIKEEDE